MTSPLVEVVITGNSSSFVESVDSAAGACEGAVTDLSAASDGLSGAFDRASGAAAALAGSLDGAAGSAGDAAGSVTAAAGDIAGSLDGLTGVADDLSLNLKGIGESFDGSAAQIDTDTALLMADTELLIAQNEKLLESLATLGPDVDEASAQSDGALETVAAMLDRLAGKAGIVGEAFGAMAKSIQGSADTADASLAETGEAASSAGGAMDIMGKAGIAAIGAVAVVAIDLGSKYQALTTNIAAWGGISVQAASKITAAFENTEGTTIYAGSQIAQAYGTVVGQLTAVEGHSLNSTQAMQVMSAAMDLAEGSGENLNTATSSLAKVMQTFQMRTGDARQAADELFSTAKGGGVSLQQVAQSVTQVHTQLGALTPPLGETGALLVDMVEHGMNGSRALRVLGSSLNSLLKPDENVIKDQSNLKTAFDDLPPSLQALGAQYEQGKESATYFTDATKNLSEAQTQAWSKFTSADTAVGTATLNLQESGDAALFVHGKFIGLGNAIDVLHNQTKGMSDEQALAKLNQDGLASSAAKLLPIIEAGGDAFNKAREEVEKHNAAAEAAQKQAQTLDHQFDLMKSTVRDLVTQFGTALVPILTDVTKVLATVFGWIAQHKIVMVALGVAIGAVLIPALYGAATAALAAAAGFTGLELSTVLITAAVLAVVAAAYELYKHWGEIWGFIKNVADDAWHFLDDNIIHPIEHGFEWVVNEIKSHWQGLLEILIAPFAPVLAIVLAFHNQIIHFFEDIPSHVMAVINDIIGFFIAMPGEIVSGIGDFVGTVFGALLNAGSWITSNVITPVETLFTNLPSELFGLVSNIVGTVFAGFLQVNSWIENHVVQPVLGIFTGLPGQIVGVVGDLVNTIFGGMTSAASWVNTNVIQPVISAFSAMPGDIGSAILAAFNGAMNIGEDVINWLKSGLNDAINWYNSHRPSLFGVSLMPALPTFGTGGFVDKPTIALIGESGPEYIIPANQLPSSGSLPTAQLPGGGTSTSTAPTGPITIALDIDGERFAAAVLNPLQTAALRGQKTGGQFTINLT